MNTGGFLYPEQESAVEKAHNGCIFNGGVGSGKSRTALYYYFSQCGGYVDSERKPHKMTNEIPLYIITTPKKRDDKEWQIECAPFRINPVVIDSWNNCHKYVDVNNAFFIFDEDRVCGKGAWAKSFLKIAKRNKWVILSATPGDDWEDYITVFLANGFYKSRKEFNDEHVVFNPHTPYPSIMKYLNEDVLYELRNSILIDMSVPRHTVRNYVNIFCPYDNKLYDSVKKNLWDPFNEVPIERPSELCYILRKVVNSDAARYEALGKLLEKHPKVVIFYNFDYELDGIRLLLRNNRDTVVAEYNGHRHDPVPTSDRWVYLVNYSAGAEGWNCITTDTIIFFSQTYSWKTYEQACGRIDRMNTKFTNLYYYNLLSFSGIDNAIARALRCKKRFNVLKYGENQINRKEDKHENKRNR